MEHVPPLSDEAGRTLEQVRRDRGAIGDASARLGWHSLRRKFVNDLKPDTSMADLCYLGGWKSTMTVMTVYMQHDEKTMSASPGL